MTGPAAEGGMAALRHRGMAFDVRDGGPAGGEVVLAHRMGPLLGRAQVPEAEHYAR